MYTPFEYSNVPIAPSKTAMWSLSISSLKSSIKNSRAEQRGTSMFRLWRSPEEAPSCLAACFTWPQVALTHHVFCQRAYTLSGADLSRLKGALRLRIGGRARNSEEY